MKTENILKDSEIKKIASTEKFVKETMQGDGSGHDWWHIHRVRNLALHICKKESALRPRRSGGNPFIVEMAALLHDLDDWKFSDHYEDNLNVRNWLKAIKISTAESNHICEIIKDLSFKGAGVATPMKTIEGMIVQDADRLDAIGAVGIARTFAYGGFRQRELYNPEFLPVLHKTFEAYKKNSGPTLNHFYEKLLLLKNIMNTKTAKAIAKERHLFMKNFLEQFFKETGLDTKKYKTTLNN